MIPVLHLTACCLVQECRSIGIEGSDVMKELQLLTCNLPDVMYSALQTLKAEKMQQAVQHYIGNTAHVQQQCKGSSSSDAVMRLLPGLQEADVEPLSREQWQVKSESLVFVSSKLLPVKE